MSTMRKVSREMPAEWALEVMRKAPYITVSFIRKDGSAYGLPLSLASAEDGRVWYFHCALEGEKLEAIEAHPEVCLSAVSKCSPTVGPKDGSFTLQYRSAVAFGRAEQVFDEGEKIRALRLICERFLPRHMDAFDESVRRSLHRTAVVRITLTAQPTGKRKQYGMTLHTGKLQQFLVGHALAGLIPDAAAVGEAEAGEDALHVEVVVVGVDFEAADVAGDG